MRGRVACSGPLTDHAISECFADGFGLRVDVQLLVDAANVVADRINADIEVERRPFVAVAFRQQLEQTYFLGRELLLRRLRSNGNLLKGRHDLPRDVGRHWSAPGGRFADRLEQPGRRGLFQQIAAGAVADRLEHLFLLGIHGEHDDVGGRIPLLQDRDALAARHARQVDV